MIEEHLANTHRARWSGALLLVMLAGFLLRAWGITYGLPHIFLSDEAVVVNQTLAMGYVHTLKPEHYGYPTGFMYLLGILYSGYYFLGLLMGSIASPQDFAMSILRDPSSVYLMARAVSVAAGTAVIGIVYLIGKNLFNPRAGFFAAVASAFTYVVIYQAHFVKVEGLETLMALIAFGLALKASRTGRGIHYALAGLCVGLTAAVKYNGGLILVPVLFFACMSRTGPKPWRNMSVVVLSAVIGFFALMPYAALDFKLFLSDLRAVSFFSTDWMDQDSSLLGWWNASSRWIGTGITLWYFLGVVFMVVRSSNEKIATALFPVLHLILSRAVSPWPNMSWQTPILPFLALLAGELAVEAWNRWPSVWARATVLFLIFASIGESAALAWRADQKFARSDTRTLALSWIESHVPSGSSLVMDHGQFFPSVAPPVRQTPESIDQNYLGVSRVSGWRYPSRSVYFELLKQANREPLYDVYPILHDDFGGTSRFWDRPSSQTLPWYQARGVTHAVLSRYDRVYASEENRTRFGDYIAPYIGFYKAVHKEGKLLAEFLPEDIRFGPEIRIYCVASSCMG